MRLCDNGIPAFPKGERRLLNLPDCVFLTEQGRCRILRVPECTGETCSFCRSRACAEDANRRWKTRMNVLDDARQARIAAAYFGGKMHRLLRAQEVLQLLSGLAGDDGLWVEDEAQRKKLHAAEEAILKEAERELNEEFAYVLGLSLEETPAFIRNLIETDEESEEAFAAHWKEKN